MKSYAWTQLFNTDQLSQDLLLGIDLDLKPCDENDELETWPYFENDFWMFRLVFDNAFVLHLSYLRPLEPNTGDRDKMKVLFIDLTFVMA